MTGRTYLERGAPVVVPVRERGILFSAPMVRALLREAREPGTGKTQTRRILKPPAGVDPNHWMPNTPGTLGVGISGDRFRVCHWPDDNAATAWGRLPCAKGGRLWVRETWADVNTDSGPAVAYRAGGLRWCSEDAYPVDYDRYPGCQFSMWWGDLERGEPGHAWRPSIFMPRWASRLTLTVTEVRVQRLAEISEDDAVAEGWPYAQVGSMGAPLRDAYPIGWFGNLWDDLHGRGAYEASPWVAALTFHVALANIDALPNLDPPHQDASQVRGTRGEVGR